jgi:hypothetical protein
MFHNKFWRSSSQVLPLALVALAAGCTPANAPVEGQLLFDDGKPVAHANLRLVPTSGSQEAVGATDEKGDFKLTSGGRDGAVPGDYKVVVTKVATAGQVKGEVPETGEDMAKAMKGAGEQTLKSVGQGKPPVVKDPVPGIYSSETTTTLTCKVESGKKLELKIKRN